MFLDISQAKFKNPLQCMCLLFIALFCLSGCEEKRRVPREVVVADKTFVIPADFEFAGYETLGTGGAVNEYRQLFLTVDINSFKNVEDTYGPSAVDKLTIEIRPVGARWKGPHYWTSRDPLLNVKPSNCKEVMFDGESYSLCQHVSKDLRIPWANYFFSINEKGGQERISVIGCMRTEKSDDGNYLCNVSAKILENIEIGYFYRSNHFDRAVELDSRVRSLVMKLYKN